MGFCCVFGCANRSDRKHKKKEGVRFHSFPQDQTLRNLWVQAIRRDYWEPTYHSKVCTEHFSDDLVDRTYVSGLRLREGAVPSIFPAFPENLKKVHEFRESPRTHGGDAEAPVADIHSTSDDCVLTDELEPTEPPKTRTDVANGQLRCSAPLCDSSKEDHPLFEFPSNYKMRRRWIRKCDLDLQDCPIDAPLYLCELHFKFDQFRSNRKRVTGYVASLKSDAVPSIFPAKIQHIPNHRTTTSASSHPYSTIDLIETSPTPSIETLNTLINFDGVFEDLFELLQCKVETLDPLDRLCTVLFDEMKFSAAKDFAKSKRDLIATQSMDDDIEDVGNFITVVLIRGLRSGWEQVIACKLTETSAEVTSQVALLEKSISFAESCGLRVLSLSTNLTTNNRLMWSAMGVDVTETERITHFNFNDHKIHVVPDACHLLTSLMAAVHLGIHLSTSLVEDEALPSTHVSSEYVKQLWKSDVKVRKSKRMLQHLQENDLEQEASDQITLESALQFFSGKTAKALESAVLSKTIHPDALTTAYFCRLVDHWFSICDSEVPEHGITTRNKQTVFYFLARVIEVCEGIKVDGCWSPLNAGMIMCTTSLREVVSVLLLQDGFDVVLLHRFCQDAAENIISQMFETADCAPEEFSKHCLETLKTLVCYQLNFDDDLPVKSLSTHKISSAPETSRKQKRKESEARITSGGSKRASRRGRVGRPKKASSTSNSPQIELQKRKPTEMSRKASSETLERVNKNNPVRRPRKNAVGRPQKNPVGKPKKNAVGRPKKNAVGRPQKNPVGRPKKNLSTSKTTEPKSRKRKIPTGTPKHVSGKRRRK